MTSTTYARSTPASSVSLRNGSSSSRFYSLARLLVVGLLHIGFTGARPLQPIYTFEEPELETATLWAYLGTAIALVLLGGAFAGLTIALMGQDELYLQVIEESGEGSEKRNAKKVLKLLKRGKHWVLVTLLVGNVITNETLPIVLDRSIGGGYAAAISSTVLVIIFGEIVPQSICVRYGLPIGAWMAPFVLFLMWIFAPITWPIAKLLDYLLGEDHGTTYKKAGLKTLVTLHKTIGGVDEERLNEDEAKIISGVLDLKEKSVGSIMTPINDVFTLPSNAVLDEDMMDDIVREGYSRIPIYEPKNKNDFVGMLLVKQLITYDPEDARKVSEFALATLPETSPDTSCLDIINFFQEGRSHMVLVSDYPGKTYGALGVVTLEDVIEELIGEEIVDESDVFVDIHKAIRRSHPPPLTRLKTRKPDVVTEPVHNQAVGSEAAIEQDTDLLKPDGEDSGGGHAATKRPSTASLTSGGKPQRMGTYLMRRKSSGSGSQGVRSVHMGVGEAREHMRKLVPSNLASRPKSTRVNTVKIKPGVSPIPESDDNDHQTPLIVEPSVSDANVGIGQDTLSSGLAASDGVQALNTGSLDKGTTSFKPYTDNEEDEDPETTYKPYTDNDDSEFAKVALDAKGQKDEVAVEDAPAPEEVREDSKLPERYVYQARSDSHSTIASLPSRESSPSGKGKSKSRKKSGSTRSGSITENIVDAGGVKKLVLEMTSSNEAAGEDAKEEASAGSVRGSRAGSLEIGSGKGKGSDGTNEEKDVGNEAQKESGKDAAVSPKKKKKKVEKKVVKKKSSTAGGSENTPLLPKD